ncbi:hypothetical protein LXL04_024780 [Taraxacum kok-saghyz]
MCVNLFDRDDKCSLEFEIQTPTDILVYCGCILLDKNQRTLTHHTTNYSTLTLHSPTFTSSDVFATLTFTILINFPQDQTCASFLVIHLILNDFVFLTLGKQKVINTYNSSENPKDLLSRDTRNPRLHLFHCVNFIGRRWHGFGGGRDRSVTVRLRGDIILILIVVFLFGIRAEIQSGDIFHCSVGEDRAGKGSGAVEFVNFGDEEGQTRGISREEEDDVIKKIVLQGLAVAEIAKRPAMTDNRRRTVVVILSDKSSIYE